MAVVGLNGWTSDKLDAMQDDVNQIKLTLRQMQSDETQSLRNRVKELESRPYRHLQAVAVPFLCACIPAAVVLLTHA